MRWWDNPGTGGPASDRVLFGRKPCSRSSVPGVTPSSSGDEYGSCGCLGDGRGPDLRRGVSQKPLARVRCPRRQGFLSVRKCARSAVEIGPHWGSWVLESGPRGTGSGAKADHRCTDQQGAGCRPTAHRRQCLKNREVTLIIDTARRCRSIQDRGRFATRHAETESLLHDEPPSSRAPHGRRHIEEMREYEYSATASLQT